MGELNDLMEFDHVIRVASDGIVTDADGIYPPELFEDELDDKTWDLMDGYSRQDGYSGPIMHNSEFIGGQMAKDILSEPGLYVAIASYYADGEVEGWAVAYKHDWSL